MKTEKMKGGIEYPVIAVALVFVGMFVLTITVGFYFRSVLVGEPIEIRTYTEYRWMNYFPSSVLFYLSYNPNSWSALNELAKMDYDKKEVLSREEFVGRFSYDEKYSRDNIDLMGFGGFNEMMKNLEKETKKEKHSYIIKDKKGLVISLGLPKDKLEGLIVTYPEEYPYNCFYKDMPVFSRETKNMRIKFVYCCSDIIDCSDYLTGPGRAECNSDPCGVGPCKLVVCGGEEDVKACEVEEVGARICVENSSLKECSDLSCGSENTNLPCRCGTATANETKPWCYKSNNKVFADQISCKESMSCGYLSTVQGRLEDNNCVVHARKSTANDDVYVIDVSYDGILDTIGETINFGDSKEYKCNPLVIGGTLTYGKCNVTNTGNTGDETTEVCVKDMGRT